MGRQLSILLVLISLLAACGGTPARPEPASIPTNLPAATNAPPAEALSAPTATAVATAAAAAAAAPTAAAAQQGSDCPAGFRRFDHELLATEPVCIPEAPQRIVALDMASVEMTLLTNKTLVGTSNWIANELPILSPQYADRLTNVENVGFPPDLEKILALKPDIILASSGLDMGEIAKAAPVVIADERIYSDWKLGTQFWSEVLNVPDYYTAMKKNYAARVAELRTALGKPGDTKVSVISASTYAVALWLPNTPIGHILSDVGLARPEAQSLGDDAALARYQAKQYIEISEERYDLVDADAIFYFTYVSPDAEVSGKESAFIKALEQKPLWRSLSAVKAGKAFFVPGYWWRSQTYSHANKVIDDLFTHLTDTTAKTAALTEQALSDSTVTALTCAAGLRPFDHELLMSKPLCVPAAPKRVIALDIASLELLLLNGEKPVATAQWILEELPLLLPQYAATLADVEGLGYPAELEKVALLKPDIILATDDTIDIQLARAIAPVVVPNSIIYDDWKLGVQFWSQVLNMPDYYAKMQDNYRARVAELQAALGQPGATKVSIISASTYGVSLWMPDSPPGSILADVGLARPDSQSLAGDSAIARYGERQYIPVSEERMDLADGDAIFYFTYASTNAETAGKESAFIKAFEQKPLWQALKAVKADKAFFVPGYWWRSQSYLLANKVIDDLFTHLTDTTAKTPIIQGR